MSVRPSPTLLDTEPVPAHFEAIIVGAGFAGLRMLYELRQQDLSVRLIEAGSDVGGTWYWNCYPGARTDSESWYYTSFSFDKDLENEWDWSERYPSQPEVLSYLRHIAERYDMRNHIEFDERVTSAFYDEGARLWSLSTDRGRRYTCSYFITAVGVLSATYRPPFPGLEEFKGEWYETSRWPHDQQVDFTGKRVALIGTGATGVQLAPMVAHTAAHLTVFQRTPNYVIPARNRTLVDVERQSLRATSDVMWKQAYGHVYGMAFDPAGRTLADVTPDEQRHILEAAWETGGFGFIFSTFDDIFFNEEANQVVAEFVRNKIRSIVKDPATAELLCPKSHPFLAKRPPLGHLYYETFNRDNVGLVDVSQSPIAAITAKGLRTTTEDYKADVIIFATGFDAFTGSLTRIDIRGKTGTTIAAKWKNGPETYLGIGVNDFPNFFMIGGPQTPFANIPVVIESIVEWIGGAIRYLRNRRLATMEPTQEAESDWSTLVTAVGAATLLPRGEDANTWFLGANIPGKAHVIQFYMGGFPNYREACRAAAEREFAGFVLS